MRLLACLLLASLACAQEEGLKHLQRAGELSAAHRDQEALEELEKAYQLLPPTYGLTRLLGETYLKAGDPRAVPVLERAVRLQPGEEAHLLLGEAYWKISDFQKSVEQFEAALKQDPKSARAQAWAGLGHQLLGHPDRARPFLEAALRLEPEGPLTNLSMGSLLAGEGKLAGAVPFLERYAAAKPDDVEVHLKLAQVHLGLGRYDDSRRALETARRLAPANKRVYYLLGRVYTVNQQPAQAKEAFAKFNELEAAELAAKRKLNAPYAGAR